MEVLKTRQLNRVSQYTISLLLVVMTTILCSFIIQYIGYMAVALIQLLVVSVIAILFDIFPVLVSALLSALAWNFFFIPPVLTLHIETAEDGLMFLMYFVVASINGVLTYKIREYERKERIEDEKAKAINLYNTLLNSLSHELRTPITTIIGAIDMVKDESTKLSDDTKNELFTEIELAGFRLNRQVENLLSMSRLEAGIIRPKTDWVDLNELIFFSIKDTKDEALNHTVIFHPDENLPLFKLDSGLIEQVFYNILHNAFLYTPENSVITIKAMHNDSGCVIHISDNGPGFPQKSIDFAFDKFYRINANEAGGTGLGLSIVKGFLEAMNGTVRLENLPTGGAKFTLEISSEMSHNTHIENE